MYCVVYKDIPLPVAGKKDEELPSVFGPYETMNEAVGSVVDLVRTGFPDEHEPWVKFERFGLDMENLKVIVRNDEGKEYFAATVNSMD